MQQVLRGKGMRKIYALGPQMTTVGPNDGNGLFPHFMIANGGADIVTQTASCIPRIRRSARRRSAVELLTELYKQGYVPPEALSWNDADDNNAFHEKLIVMDFDGSLSTELAMIKDKQAYYEEMQTVGLPLSNDGKPMPAQVGAGGCSSRRAPRTSRSPRTSSVLHAAGGDEREPEGRAGPHGAVDTAHCEGRSLVARPSDPHRAPFVQESVLGPTTASYYGYNPAWGQVSAEQLWGVVYADVIKSGMTPTAAVDKAFRRAETIFANYTFG